MGIINTTPDSFSDGGQFDSVAAAVRHGERLVAEGADILDVGGESTRPGAERVSQQIELDRVIPVIEGLSQATDAAISIDSYKPRVMQEAVAAGADMINDINALRSDGALEVAANAQVPVCLMHMLGEPRTMQDAPHYRDVVVEVGDFLQQRIDACRSHGIAPANLVVDPGIGFGKTLQHNLQLLGGIQTLMQRLDCPLLIGASRKSMINSVLERFVEERVAASVGLAVQAALNGAKILRVHDVRETCDALRMVEAVRDAGSPGAKTDAHS